jgi:hypothetical protein
VACVVASIKGLGLEVSPEKSETLWFCRRAVHGEPPAGYHLRMGRVEAEVRTRMKYLDSHWAFDAHFERLVLSVEATAYVLGRLLPRLGGPGVESLQLVRRLHRTVAIRIVRGFRTVLTAAAGVLAGLPPFELQVIPPQIFLHTRRRRGQGSDPTDSARHLTRRPRYEDRRAGAKGPRGRPTKLGRLVGRGRTPTDLQGDAGAHGARTLR